MTIPLAARWRRGDYALRERVGQARPRRHSLAAADLQWARRYIRFHGKRHPSALGAGEVAAVLTTHLAIDGTVAAGSARPAVNRARGSSR